MDCESTNPSPLAANPRLVCSRVNPDRALQNLYLSGDNLVPVHQMSLLMFSIRMAVPGVCHHLGLRQTPESDDAAVSTEGTRNFKHLPVALAAGLEDIRGSVAHHCYSQTASPLIKNLI